MYNLEVCVHLWFCMHEHFHLVNNPFKYEYKTFQVFIHPIEKNLVNAKCNSWIVHLITFKVNDSTHMQMLIVQKMQNIHYPIQV